MASAKLKATLEKVVSDAYVIARKQFLSVPTTSLFRRKAVNYDWNKLNNHHVKDGFTSVFAEHIGANKDRIIARIQEEGYRESDAERRYEELLKEMKILLLAELQQQDLGFQRGHLDKFLAAIELKTKRIIP